ncbi:MAG: CYTH domain-containing protein [Clostridiaceae bacterium]|jgi:CYTH domain-containing protein|nr:CYTH domain-containing protein [Clostridiaceae bacterium]
MAKETERKFLVKDDSFKKLSKGILYRQGYLPSGSNITVRVRIIENKAYLAIKGPSIGLSRLEYEYEIPMEDADEILEKLCDRPIIEKYRYTFEYKGFTWEIDEFLNENQGLVIAEIELKNENQQFPVPDFIGEEVTFDHRYRNSYLARHPYSSWQLP